MPVFDFQLTASAPAVPATVIDWLVPLELTLEPAPAPAATPSAETSRLVSAAVEVTVNLPPVFSVRLLVP